MVATSLLNLPTLQINNNSEKKNKIINILSPLIVDNDRLSKLRTTFLDEIELGLAENPRKKSSLQMENTFVPKLLDGTESGEYMALDLGSTNFRILLLKLQDGKIFNEIINYYDVPLDKRLGPGEDLFHFLASCLEDFIDKNNIPKRNRKLGFTFSFPMAQNSIDNAILLAWTKSFTCSGVEGEDVVKLLNNALQKHKLDITVNAILNDTTGTLIKGSYIDKRCAMGIIIGTGTNACYIEEVNNIEKWAHKLSDEEMIVDSEWGAFGDNGCIDFIRTQWDDAVDSQSLIPKSFTFDKYIGGKFVGDIVREVLRTLASLGLFGTEVTTPLATQGSLTTAQVSYIEQDAFDGSNVRTKEIARTSLNMKISDDDACIMQYVCGLVSYRAVLLAAALAAILLERMQRPHCTIAIDGSVYEHHPRFKPLMNHLISQYSPNTPFNLILAKDGSGKGAALIAAIADRLNK